ncbi:hypothetical protein DFJ74DRAFT_774002 [Hyaloraphidium curvatum]|nr:hypothetical protein DFJ74DRAFT_774002 [Hyaloraphidium curvatum]
MARGGHGRCCRGGAAPDGRADLVMAARWQLRRRLMAGPQSLLFLLLPPAPAMKVQSAALLLLAAAAALLLAGPAPAAAQASPNANSVAWVRGNTCVPGQNVGSCCCAKRAKTVQVTKFTTRTAIKTIKRTKTVTRTVTTTSVAVPRRLAERDAAPEVVERALPEEPEVAEAEEVAAPEVAERAVPEPETELAEAADEAITAAPGHELFARNLCQACPAGVSVRVGANSNNNARRCCPRATKFVTRTKTTTKVTTKTVKTATRTVTTTSVQPAAFNVPVQVLSQTVRRLAARQGTPVARATARLLAPDNTVLGSCVTDASGRCNIVGGAPLAPNTVYRVEVTLEDGTPAPNTGAVFRTSDTGAPPPFPPTGIPIVINDGEVTTVSIRRRELVARREADGVFRRALKARATPAPAPF